MKKVFVTLLTLTLCSTLSYAQKIDWGAKVGVNYNFGGDLSEAPTTIGDSFEDVITGADAKAGYHVGLWTKIDVLGMYVRPELIYTQLNNTYGANAENSRNEADFKTKKLDIPVLFGVKVAGPLHIFAGPSFQYILDSDFDVNDVDAIDTNDFSVGLQIGAGLELGKLGIDVRWEKGFSNDANGQFLNTDFNVDNRPNQIIFGLSYRFNERNN
jgi:hypothetical protein